MRKFMLVVVLLAAAVFCSGTVGSNYAIETRTHNVRTGETLWEIGWRYMPEQDKTRDVREFIFDIRKANKLEVNAVLLPGQTLVIPLEVKK